MSEAEAATIPADEGQRTHPLGFVVSALDHLRSAILPLIAGLFFMRGEGLGIGIVLGIVAAIAILNAVFAWLAWTKLRYFVGATDIRVERGIVSKAKRSVPYERIQDVSLEQKFLARIFGLVEVKFETGAGGKDELALAYLAEDEGERLRELVRERTDGIDAAAEKIVEGAAEPGGRLIFAMDNRRLFTFGLFEFSLVIFAALLGAAQQFDFLLPVDIWDGDLWESWLGEGGRQVAEARQSSRIVALIGGLAGVTLLGFATGIFKTVLRDWDFRLERTAKGFRRRRGLLTRTDVVMPVHRVQAAQVVTGWLRRRFGWHGLKFVSLAQDAGSASHDVAPFATLDEIWPIAGEAGLHPPPADGGWQRHSTRRWVDRAIFESILALGVVAVIGVAVDVLAAGGLLIAAAMAIGFGNAFGWARRRWLLDDKQVFARRGLLSPTLLTSRRMRLQSAEIAQGPLGRWRGYADLHLGLAGGRFRLTGLPLADAERLRAAILESIAAVDFSRMQD